MQKNLSQPQQRLVTATAMIKPFLIESFWKKVEKTEGCWNWLGWKNRQGYGLMRKGPVRYIAHRISYEIHKGEIPKGLIMDHLCRNCSCVNPDHLEAVTVKENTMRGNAPSAANARKTHCIRGHEFNEENTRVYPGKYGPHRACRACSRIRYKDALMERLGL